MSLVCSSQCSLHGEVFRAGLGYLDVKKGLEKEMIEKHISSIFHFLFVHNFVSYKMLLITLF